jgi:hypothetical protein
VTSKVFDGSVNCIENGTVTSKVFEDSVNCIESGTATSKVFDDSVNRIENGTARAVGPRPLEDARQQGPAVYARRRACNALGPGPRNAPGGPAGPGPRRRCVGRRRAPCRDGARPRRGDQVPFPPLCWTHSSWYKTDVTTSCGGGRAPCPASGRAAIRLLMGPPRDRARARSRHAGLTARRVRARARAQGGAAAGRRPRRDSPALVSLPLNHFTLSQPL